MAFNPTSAAGEYHYLVEFSLDNSSMYYADQDMSIQVAGSTGRFYEGRLPQGGILTRSLTSFQEAKESIQTFPVQLDNRDGEIGRITRRHELPNRTVRVLLGEGNVYGDYSEVFRGHVIFPGGITWDEESATITIADNRLRHRRNLPLAGDTIDLTTYPNAATSVRSAPLPILYGSWASCDEGGTSIPCACVDTSTPKFRVAGHGLQSIDKYLLNGVKLNSVSEIQNVSLAEASFELNGVSYDSASDIMSVNCRGLTNGSGLISQAGDTFQHLHTAYTDLTAGDFDATAITLLNATIGYSFRRFIPQHIDNSVVASQLLNEMGADSRFIGGKYSPVLRDLQVGSGNPQYYSSDIAYGGNLGEGLADYKVVADPNRDYFNQIRSRFRRDPVASMQSIQAGSLQDSVYEESFAKTATAATANVSMTKTRSWDMEWLYKTTEAQDRATRELIQFSSEMLAVNTRLTNRSMLLNLGDKIDLYHDVFTGMTFQVRNIETHLGDMTSRIMGFNIYSNEFSAWTVDGAANWYDSNSVVKQQSGFWADNRGYVSRYTEPVSGMSGYWILDDVLQAEDKSGNAKDGTLVGSPPSTTGPFSEPRAAMSFDGTTPQYVDISDEINECGDDRNGAWMAWVKLDDATPASEQAFMSIGIDSEATYVCMFCTTAGKLEVYYADVDAEGGVYKWWIQTQDVVFSNNTWAHIAFTTTDSFVDQAPPFLYVDGVLVGTNKSKTGIGSYVWLKQKEGEWTDMNIGSMYENSARSRDLAGAVSQVKIFSKDLTAAEILSEKNALATDGWNKSWWY